MPPCHNHNGNSACGGLIREDGKLLKGFTLRISPGNPLIAELKGVITGLEIAFTMKPGNIEVDIDSKEAFDLITLRCPADHPNVELVRQIFSLVSQNWNVSFNLIMRESNCCADALAKRSHSMPDLVFDSEIVPNFLVQFLKNDVMGITTPRLV
ncbi:uncharacterized protein LOC130724975 [Lotus japonicus]|uniref:uncharacterized protein LOC130724975 n=1 Tax=Lotus japonicus TaxID=34305 RepID=UPI002584B72F|nr:uncharacterized protein LOC130724975 [Lotus japonicus]